MCIAAMGGLAGQVAGGGGLRSAARSGLFGLVGKALAGKKKANPDRQSILYPAEGR